MELISGRQAADRLAWAGLGERQARAVIAAGLAGPVVRAGGAFLHDAERVQVLLDAPVVPDHVTATLCPRGLFVARGRDLDGDGWRFSPFTGVFVRDRIEVDGSLRAVTTVGSFVTGCAEVVDVHREDGGYHLTARAATGSWTDAYVGARVLTGPGRPWVILEPPRTRGDAA